jgi:hypothetical protein
VRGSDTLFAVPFDRKRLEIRGKPVPVLENVAMDYVRGAQFALSRNGTLVYVPGRGQGTQERSLVLVDREGNARPLTEVRRNYSDPCFSPDGKRIAFASEDDIWTLDIKSGRSNGLRSIKNPRCRSGHRTDGKFCFGTTPMVCSQSPPTAAAAKSA